MDTIVLFIIVVGLQFFLGKFLPAHSYQWFNKYLNYLDNLIGLKRINLEIIRVIIYFIPFVILLVLIRWLGAPDSPMANLLGSLLSIVIFWYLMTLDTLMKVVEKTSLTEDLSQSEKSLNTAVDIQRQCSNYRELGVEVLLSANIRVFTLLFLYAIFGLWGSVLFIFFQLCIHNNIAVTLLSPINQVLAWIPTRITAFIYCMIVNPSEGAMIWLKNITYTLANEDMLLKCIDKSIGEQLGDSWEMDSMQAIKNYLQYSLVIWLIFAILLSLIF